MKKLLLIIVMGFVVLFSAFSAGETEDLGNGLVVYSSISNSGSMVLISADANNNLAGITIVKNVEKSEQPDYFGKNARISIGQSSLDVEYREIWFEGMPAYVGDLKKLYEMIKLGDKITISSAEGSFTAELLDKNTFLEIMKKYL